MNLNAIELESIPLKAIITPDVMTVGASAHLAHVLTLMQTNAISSIVAVDSDDKPIGIFTEQDAIRLMAEKRSISEMRMGDVMTHPVLVVPLNLGYAKAYQKMMEHKVRHLVVVDEEGKLLGLASEGDFLHHMGIEYLVELKTVGSAMSQSVATLEANLPLSQAVDLMNTTHFSCIVAMSEGKPVGVITERDVVRFAIKGVDSSSVAIQEVMSSPLQIVLPDMPLQTASRRMELEKIRRLIVVDDKGVLAGILTRHDIAKSLQGSYIEYLQETLDRKNRDLLDSESRLREIEQREFYQDLVDQVSDSIFVIDAEDSRILDANQKAADNLRMPLAELLNLRVVDFSVAVPNLEYWFDSFLPKLREGEVLTISDHRRADGSVFPVEVKARLVQLGNREYVVAIARDLTERMESTQKLIENEQRFRMLFDESPISMAYVSFSGEVLSLNKRFTEVFGYTKDDVPTLEDWFIKAHPQQEYRDQVRTRWGHSLDGAKSGNHTIPAAEYQVICKQGKTKLITASGVTTEHGFLAILEDITEQRLASEALKESAETYFSIITTSQDGFWIVDQQARFLDVNEAYAKMSGYSREELMSMSIGDLDAIETPDVTKKRIELIKHQGGQRFLTKHRRKNGDIYDVEVNATYWSGGGGRFFVFLRDVTERINYEDRLRQAAAVFGSTNEGVMITDVDGQIQMVNEAFCSLTGYGKDEVIGQPAKILQSGRHSAEFYHEMWESINDVGSWQGEIWNRRKDGTTYPEWLSISAVKDDDNRVNHYVGVFSDISQLKESEQKLNHLAHHDMLTGLPNRLMLQTRLDQALAQARRKNTSLALLLLDLDRFKDVNDSFGHSAGDELLKQVASILKEGLREVDLVCRMGGDEFAILLEDIQHPEDAGKVASKVTSLLAKSWNISNGYEVAIGGSVGISLFPEQSGDSQALLQHADAALYRAKSEGRGRFHYFTEELTRDARKRLDLEARLIKGIARNELEVYYQPQIHIATGKLVGAEALVRWNDPEHGLIGPNEFIPLAEQTGLINDIGLLVLKQGCSQLKAWLDAGCEPFALAVNLSAVQLRHSDIRPVIANVLEETGLEAKYLELEITESALMEREQESIQLLDSLRSLGVRIAIDDFGTGYSSLAYLKKFPLDVLKIDKSFVDDIPADKDDMVIAATIVAMGHSLGLQVLAEGVETEEQLAFLRSKNCHYYQGYLRSKPVPADQFANFLTYHN
ncbi:EAL domain-containing protein [Neptuniibacter caesariensis]|uniref:cyclic-guanylate-specific phosphodiesterase n=1 Tax=Neptuniibacter caesariensis TaxID=207954 RepID=A0A7U8C333_NEPCE|nr:EAL domain-containing protein [Neptuniibacter caesariensis]EAR60329.1 hypothetical protein MED92_00325 [Neptuniibacter caesariensis]